MLYRACDLLQQGLSSIPRDKTATEVPAYWMQPSSVAHEERADTAAERWDNLVFVKHQRTSGSSAQLDKAVPLRHTERYTYEPLPLNMSIVSSSSIASLSHDLASLDVPVVLPGILESNGCRSTHYRTDAVVAHDHSFTRGPGEQPALDRTATSQAGPIADFPPFLLSPSPAVHDDHVLQTLEKGCNSIHVRALPPPPTIQQQLHHHSALTEKQHKVLLRRSVCLNENGAKLLEQRTRSQANSSLWHTSRSVRLTASNFGRILHLRKTTDRDAVAHSLTSAKRTTEAMAWGKEKEAEAGFTYSELRFPRVASL